MDSINMIGAAAAQPAASGNAPAGNTDKLANQEVFLQLLVAQIKNQDPLKPTDGVQYLTQLAQFSSLEQLIGIRAELKNISQAPPVADPAGDVTGN